MKIAILSFYNGHFERGAENWALEFAEYLNNHQVVIFQNQDFDVNWEKSISRKGLGRRFFIDYWSLMILRFTVRILPILWKEDFDILIPINGGWQPFLIRILTWLRRSKMVIVGHSGRGWDDRINIYTFPDVFVALTKVGEEWAKKVNPFVKVKRISNGVNLEKFSPEGLSVKIPLHRPIVLCVSALSKTKRIDLVIKAVLKVPQLSLLVVGEGELNDELIRMGKKLLEGRFYLTQFSYELMPKVYRVADLFTLVSWENEAFPLVYLEAMASGLPVIATKDLTREEIIGESGLLVNPMNTDDYANAFKEVLRRNWSNKPRIQAEKFSWKRVSAQYEKLLLDLR